MTPSVDEIPFLRLSLSLLPVLVVLFVFFRWSIGSRTALHAVVRMVTQLALVGYVLTFIFGSNHPAVVLGTLTVMLVVASWIALRPLTSTRTSLYPSVFLSISIGGVLTLVLITQGVLAVDVWHEGSVLIPLGGMIFATSMNTVSLAAERFKAERERAVPYPEARQIALRSAVIPQINTLFAVGVVAFPGMMTGQILSGVEPLVAVRYQIMVMCMMFGSAGISAACFLQLQRPAEDPQS